MVAQLSLAVFTWLWPPVLCGVFFSSCLALCVKHSSASGGFSGVGAHSGVTGRAAEDRAQPRLRWEDVMTWPHSAGTQAFKKPKKQPQSQRWFHGRKAHPVTLKKPNCLLQREKATSCHRPCSGKNVSGLVAAVRVKYAEAGARNGEPLEVMGAQGLGSGPREHGGLRWASLEFAGKTSLSAVMLIFQPGGTKECPKVGTAHRISGSVHESPR